MALHHSKPPLLRLRLVHLLAILALASGCQGVTVRETAGGQWVQFPPNSTLTLNRAVVVPQDRARVFLRNGRLSPQGANIGPSCGLEIRVMSRDGPYSIAAGTYSISRVQPVWTEVARRKVLEGVHVRLASATSGGGTTMIQEGYHFWLEGGPDRNLMRLTCLGRLDDMPWAKAPTLDEIRAALGGVATLRLDAS